MLLARTVQEESIFTRTKALHLLFRSHGHLHLLSEIVHQLTLLAKFSLTSLTRISSCLPFRLASVSRKRKSLDDHV